MRFLKLAGLIMLLATGPLFAGEWQINKDASRKVVFNSTTTLLDFQGTTEEIDGYYYNDGSGMFDGMNELYFEVQLATFDTGIGKRDRDMREDVLQTDKFPRATFKGSVTKHEQVADSILVTAVGEFSLHGHKKKMEITAMLKQTDKTIAVASTFSVFLKDFSIEAPSLLAFVKVAEEIKIDLNFVLKKVK